MNLPGDTITAERFDRLRGVASGPVEPATGFAVMDARRGLLGSGGRTTTGRGDIRGDVIKGTLFSF